MTGREVYEILRIRDIDFLYHANTVLTSCTFLEQGALASREFVEQHGLIQTPQSSDETDKAFGVWGDIFLDSDDYHRRIKRVNHYGPVLFKIDARVLCALPEHSEVHVTKTNPTKWHRSQTYNDRYFPTATHLRAFLCKGTFDQMITIRTRSGALPFSKFLAGIYLDNPRRSDGIGADVFETAIRKLKTSAASGNVSANLIVGRNCAPDCRCVTRDYSWRWDTLRRNFLSS